MRGWIRLWMSVTGTRNSRITASAAALKTRQLVSERGEFEVRLSPMLPFELAKLHSLRQSDAVGVVGRGIGRDGPDRWFAWLRGVVEENLVATGERQLVHVVGQFPDRDGLAGTVDPHLAREGRPDTPFDTKAY